MVVKHVWYRSSVRLNAGRRRPGRHQCSPAERFGTSGIFTLQGPAVNAGEVDKFTCWYCSRRRNAMTPVPARLVKLIQSSQFVNFAELLPDNLKLLLRLQASAVTGAN